MWLSSLLVDEFGQLLSRTDAFPSSSSSSTANAADSAQSLVLSKVSRLVLKLGLSWVSSLKSVSVQVKSCSVQIISGLLQEITDGLVRVRLGNVGFSSGVHYWELRIEVLPELGHHSNQREDLFVGISKKPFRFSQDIYPIRITLTLLRRPQLIF